LGQERRGRKYADDVQTCTYCSALNTNEKLSYRRESAHLTSLYRMVSGSYN